MQQRINQFLLIHYVEQLTRRVTSSTKQEVCNPITCVNITFYVNRLDKFTPTSRRTERLAHQHVRAKCYLNCSAIINANHNDITSTTISAITTFNIPQAYLFSINITKRPRFPVSYQGSGQDQFADATRLVLICSTYV
jgi:hypothetical protein